MIPPPIQEPWKLDQLGRLTSTAWILWLQSIAAGATSTGTTTTTTSGTTTPVVTNTTTTIVINNVPYDLNTIISEVGMYAELGDTDSSSTFSPIYLTENDVYLNSGVSASTSAASSASTDNELLCWMSF